LVIPEIPVLAEGDVYEDDEEYFTGFKLLP
jgi:hypothetical protein